MKYANGRWEITDSFTKEILAYMNGTSQIPFGLNQWHFPLSKCSDKGKDYRTLSFHKYVEQPGHYCCNDGTCFTSENVRDGIRNCVTGEDEDWPMIEMPSNYDNTVPPSNILVDFNIENFIGINDHESTFDVYFQINITWFEKKFKFHYLKNHENIISDFVKNKIWVPKNNFAFVKETFNDFEETVYIEKRNATKMSAEISILNVSEINDGSVTPIIRFSEHHITFFCEFNGVSLYPFGPENCSFDFYLLGRANRFTKIKPTLKYPARRSIGQYDIMGWKVENRRTESKNVVRITVSLTKRKFNIIMMNYIPSLLMNIINQATNYITGDSKYDLIITVNITSMVVLATIYMSVSMSLPNTPDIKPVEIWLFFSIAYPFWVIITNVVMQVSLNCKVLHTFWLFLFSIISSGI